MQPRTMLLRAWHLLVLCLALAPAARAVTPTGPLAVNGTMDILDPIGRSVLGATPVTGTLDASAGTVTFDPIMFFGFLFKVNGTLLGPGQHNTPVGQITVGAGQMGALLNVTWSFNKFQALILWQVTQGPAGQRYKTLDSDGDGIPGHAFTTGPFLGFSLVYDFVAGVSPPGVKVAIDVAGGNLQECSKTGGSDVTATASVQLLGGARLGSVQWFLDGQSVATGRTAQFFAALGTHQLEALATTAGGVTDSNRIQLIVRDTRPPTVKAGFRDRQTGQLVTNIANRNVEKLVVDLSATDVCDAHPQVSGVVSPVFGVRNGDLIRIKPDKRLVRLPTSALELNATAKDASGNIGRTSTVLHIGP